MHECKIKHRKKDEEEEQRKINSTFIHKWFNLLFEINKNSTEKFSEKTFRAMKRSNKNFDQRFSFFEKNLYQQIKYK